MLLMDEQRKWLLEMKYITGEDAVKIVQVVTKDSRYYLNLIDTAGEDLIPIFF